MMPLGPRLRRCPVIPSVWNDRGLEQVTQIPVSVVYLQYGGLFTIADMTKKIHAVHPDASVFFHIDLAEGIAADETGVRYIGSCGVQGILTTKPALVEAAKKNGMPAILRVFIQDSRSLKRAVQVAQRCGPDALDVLPGPVVPEVIGDLKAHLSQPIVAGGLIRNEEQVLTLLKAGCLAIGTSQPDLWALNRVVLDAVRK
jgi:glycerol uptake operon antiterminator